MKKMNVVALMLGVLAALVLGSGIASAQGPVTGNPPPGNQRLAHGWPVPWQPVLGELVFNQDYQTQMEAALAKALGLTVDELKAAIKSGKTIPQIAQSKNITLAKLRDDVRAAQKAFIAQAVKDGKLTQAQADWITQRMDAIDKLAGTNGLAGGNFGGRAGGGPGGMMGPGNRPGRNMGPGMGFGPAPRGGFNNHGFNNPPRQGR